MNGAFRRSIPEPPVLGKTKSNKMMKEYDGLVGFERIFFEDACQNRQSCKSKNEQDDERISWTVWVWTERFRRRMPEPTVLEKTKTNKMMKEYDGLAGFERSIFKDACQNRPGLLGKNEVKMNNKKRDKNSDEGIFEEANHIV
ncbi:hypothetical protein FE782_22645 [Paenibacillus antri]|uniref:Uncharacterized protein n=1 Tax=Paenibacillus antri TaxID=2582848 RepID=A0A5R9G6S0_9BACL|nr:hypothetical protein [Paenibacillus antri]TLS49810.1 hypothetical protein FE782_22645 [Paenibacillus antri]